MNKKQDDILTKVIESKKPVAVIEQVGLTNKLQSPIYILRKWQGTTTLADGSYIEVLAIAGELWPGFRVEEVSKTKKHIYKRKE